MGHAEKMRTKIRNSYKLSADFPMPKSSNSTEYFQKQNTCTEKYTSTFFVNFRSFLINNV